VIGLASRFLSILYLMLKPIVHVRIGLIKHRSIGSLTGNPEYFLRCEKVIAQPQRELKILISGNNPVNRQILTMLKRSSWVIESDWLWSLLNNIRQNYLSNELASKKDFVKGLWCNLDHAGMRRLQDKSEWNPWQEAGPQLTFTSAELERGQEILKFIGVPASQPYVCMHARDRLYTDSPDFTRDPSDHFSFFDYRDCDIKTYMPAANFLTEKGVWVIRVGHMEPDVSLVSENPMIIDYASHFRKHIDDSEFADVYLQAHCRFFLGCTAGIHYYSHIFDVPMALVNMAPLAESGRSMHDLFILKKYWNTVHKRYMTWREMIDRGAGGNRLWHDQQAALENEGIEIHSNTADEVLALVREMEERLSGEWIGNSEDHLLQERFKAVFPEDNCMRDFPGYAGSGFLRNNQYLL